MNNSVEEDQEISFEDIKKDFDALCQQSGRLIKKLERKLKNSALRVQFTQQNRFPDVSLSSSEISCGDSISVSVKVEPPNGYLETLKFKLG